MLCKSVTVGSSKIFLIRARDSIPIIVTFRDGRMHTRKAKV